MRLFTGCLLSLLFCLSLPADDVTDWIDDGLKAYKAGNSQEAIQSLEYAAQLIRQQKGEKLVGLFPDAPAGWRKLDGETTAMGGAMLGGGTNASISYERDDDSGDSIEISVTTDNPMIGMMSAAFSSPMMMSSSGQKMIKLKGRKAALDYDAGDRSGDINLVIADRVLVSVNGYGVTEEELRDFASGIDLDAIEAAAKE